MAITTRQLIFESPLPKATPAAQPMPGTSGVRQWTVATAALPQALQTQVVVVIQVAVAAVVVKHKVFLGCGLLHSLTLRPYIGAKD